MQHFFENDFIQICNEIIELNKTEKEWAEIESCDMFQKGNYVGGFEEIENAFTFSYYLNTKEFWFQLNLSQIKSVVKGEMKKIEIRVADL